MKKFTLFASACLMATLNANATEWFCSPAGAGDESGDSWTNAFPAESIADVIENVEPGDIVYLLEGTYTGTQIRPVVGISVIGGFPATATDTDTSGYNPWVNKTIFNAQGKNGTGPFIKVSGGDNPSYEPTTFKGITITGAVGQQTTTYSGTAFNCTRAKVLMEDVVFDSNTSWCGGVVVPASGSKFHAKHCVWTNNKNINTDVSKNNWFQCILNGRGSETEVTDIVLEGCVMVNNTIESPEAKAAACYGGGMSMQDKGATLAMVNCFVDGGGLTIKQNGGFLRCANATASNNYITNFFAFNTLCNFKTTASECKGNLISFNGYAPFYIQGNLMITDTKATSNDDKANNAIFVQGWNSKDMSDILSGGDNSITGSIFSTYAANNCTVRTQQSTDNWLAPAMSEVFGSNKIKEKDGRYFLEPVAAYGDVNLADALENYQSYEMPENFRWANVDLSVDLFGNKRATTTYRGAYDPNANPASSGITSVYTTGGSQIIITSKGNGNFTVKGAEGMATVYDMSGRIVKTQRIDDSILSITDVASGIYIVRLGDASVKIAR